MRRAKSGVRVLPVTYSDNYVSLLPGETQTVTIEAATADFAGEAPLLTVDGWNVTTTAHTFGDIAVAPNPAVGVAHVAPIRAIRCGAGWIDGYAADCDVTGGGYVLTDNKIDTAGVADAAPELLYRSERYGDCTYTIPVTAKDNGTSMYLHCAPPLRRNGLRQSRRAAVQRRDQRSPRSRRLRHLAAAGGKNRAVVRTFGASRRTPTATS